MAKIDIPGLVIKKRGPRTHHYWQPSATLKAAGWQSIPLGTDLRAAQKAAEAQNEKVEQWRSGGAAPRTVKKFIKSGTMDQLIDRYLAERLPQLGENTQREYRSKLSLLRRWAGPEQVQHIDRTRVRKLRDVLLKPDKTGYVAANRAAGAMRVLRTLLKFAIDEGFLPEDAKNAAAEQNVPTPPPRDHVWPSEAVDLFVEAAHEAGQPGLALAIRLGREWAQREGDILRLSIRNWAVIPKHKIDPDDWERIAEPNPDGVRDVRALRIIQGKTRVPIEVPIVGETRRLIEQAILDAKAAHSTVIMLERHYPAPEAKETQEGPSLVQWTETRFQRAIAALRLRAAEKAQEEGNADLAADIVSLQFRDLRRTGVVWLGELGIEDHLIAAITGHKLERTKKILETYMPRTTKMATKAIALRMERDTTPEAQERSKKA